MQTDQQTQSVQSGKCIHFIYIPWKQSLISPGNIIQYIVNISLVHGKYLLV